MDEQVVIFELNREKYGVEVGYVQSIIPMQHINTVPGAPAFVEGVINLREAIIPVVDLGARFGLADATAKVKPVIVVIEFDGLQIGLIVDKVLEVTRIPQAAIEPPAPLLVNIDTAYLRGIGKMDETVVILLDLRRIFSAEEQVALQETV